MTLDDLCDALDAASVDVAVAGDLLAITAPRGALTPELRQALADHKPTLIEALAEYRPLDEVVAASEAARRTLTHIEHRLRRVTAAAEQPDATSLDHQLVADWTAIRHAKLAGDHAS
jgi:hypothetical protein